MITDTYYLKRAGWIPGIVIAFALFLPTAASADVTMFAEGPSSASAGSLIPVALNMRVTESINAVNVTVHVQPATAVVERFDDSDSAIRLWLERGTPTEGGVKLEGVIPGGIGPGFTDVVRVGTLWIRANDPGVLRIAFSDALVYLNQPTPTRDDVTSEQLSIPVRMSGAQSTDESGVLKILDSDVRIVRETELSDGRRTVVFDIKTDRGTVDSVMIRERWLGIYGRWHEVTSPSTLSDAFGVSILDVSLPVSLGSLSVVSIVPGTLKIIWSLIAITLVTLAVRFLRKRY
jgi:hypothetical protein